MSSKERETKPIIGAPERSIQDLFRLDERTVVSKSHHQERLLEHDALTFLLVTGGCGAVGLEAARAILESGGDVVCLDLPAEPPGDAWSENCSTSSDVQTKGLNVTQRPSTTQQHGLAK